MKPERLFDIPRYQASNYPQKDAVCTKKGNTWWKLSIEEFIKLCDEFSKGLLAVGVKPDDKIAIVSKNNRSEWNVVDIGSQQIGAITVPLYPNISENDYVYILNEAEVKLVFCGDSELYEKMKRIVQKVPSIQRIYTFDEVQGVPSWQEIIDKGKTVNYDEVEKIKINIKASSLATIIYTSGTTGLPKGVMLSHSNILSNVVASSTRIPETVKTGSIALSFLPLCHIYERMIFYLYMYNGIRIYYARSLETIVEDAQEVKPDIMTVVPRLLEKVYARIMEKSAELKGFKKWLFVSAVNHALKWEPDASNGILYELLLRIYRLLVFNKMRRVLGGRIKVMVSGGAALPPHLCRFFNGAGLPTIEGYGLTETSPVIAVNEFKRGGMRIGTVGKPIPGVSVKIAEDGEILVKGPNVMLGYYKKEEETRNVFTVDGYFATGDIGELVDGFLKITDRKKELFKTSGGKYIAPQPIENRLKRNPFVEMACVIGEGRPFPSALIVPNYEYLKSWANKNNINANSIQELLSHPQVIKLYEEIVAEVNRELGKWEQIKKFRLLPEPFSIEKEELTPTLKLKRRIIHMHMANLIEEIYKEV